MTTSTAKFSLVSKLASFEPVPPMLAIEALTTALDKDGNEKNTLVEGLVTFDTQVGDKEVPFLFKVNFSHNDKTVNCLSFGIDKEGSVNYDVNRNKMFGAKKFTVITASDNVIKTYHQLAFDCLAKIESDDYDINPHNDKGYVIFSRLIELLDLKPSDASFPYARFTKQILATVCKDSLAKIDSSFVRLHLYATAQSKLLKSA